MPNQDFRDLGKYFLPAVGGGKREGTVETPRTRLRSRAQLHLHALCGGVAAETHEATLTEPLGASGNDAAETEAACCGRGRVDASWQALTVAGVPGMCAYVLNDNN